MEYFHKLLHFPSKKSLSCEKLFPQMMQISLETKHKILAFHELGLKQSEIATKLAISQGSVSKIIKKKFTYGTVDHAKGNGRPKVISQSISAIIERERRKNPKMSLRKIAAIVSAEMGVSTSYSSIKRFFNDNNVFAYRPKKKPLLTKRQINLRFNASKEWIFMEEEEVKTIIFSDESKFNLVYSDGNVSVWREPGTAYDSKNISSTVKHGGGSIMLWGCFSYYGVGKLQVIKGTMDSAAYVNILSRNLRPSAEQMHLDEFIFQQDNDPKHTSALAEEYFEKKGIRLLNWPPQSPDMNPIENIWAHLKSKIAERRPKNIKELEVFAQQECNKITPEECRNYALSFKRRALALYRAKGKHTRY